MRYRESHQKQVQHAIEEDAAGQAVLAAADRAARLRKIQTAVQKAREREQVRTLVLPDTASRTLTWR